MYPNQEIYVITIIGIVLGLILVGFIVTMLFLYQRRQQRQEQEVQRLKDIHEKEVLRSQLEIQENTFKTIAQELHDNIGQMLSVVKLTLSIIPIEKDQKGYEQLKSSQQLLHKVIADLSDLTKSLHTDRIMQVGLAESIRFELESLENSGIVHTTFNKTGVEVNFTQQKAIFLFRIFQEAVNNMLKHAKASTVSVNLTYTETIFTLEISDDGVGFDAATKKQQTNSSSGVGLKSMYNRSKLIGAELIMASEPGKGTTILVELPLQKEQ